MKRANSWTPEQDMWLRENYPATQPEDLVALYRAEFGHQRTLAALRKRAKVLRLRKADGYRKHHQKSWSDERIEWFRSYVPGHTEPEISAEHERLFGIPLNRSQVKNAKIRYGVKSGTVGGRFEKGHVPANKGKTWDEYMSAESQESCKRTQFRKGEVHDRPDGWLKPVGYERISKDGYVEVKVKDSREDGIQPQRPGEFNRNYRMKHHVVWEQANGQPVPEHAMIVFADGDKRNFDPENLVAVPRRLWCRISQMGMDYWDRGSLEACMARAELHARMGELRRSL